MKQARARTRRPRDDEAETGVWGAPRKASEQQVQGEGRGQTLPGDDRGRSARPAPHGGGQRSVLLRHLPGVCWDSSEDSRGPVLSWCRAATTSVARRAHPIRKAIKQTPHQTQKNRLWDDKQEFQDDTSRTSRGQNVHPGLPW